MSVNENCSNCAFQENNDLNPPCSQCSMMDNRKPNFNWHPKIALSHMHFVSKEQPAPKQNSNPAIWACVIQDMAARDILGASRYGTRLQAGNGRDMMKDAYEEALDLACYLRGALFERDGK